MINSSNRFAKLPEMGFDYAPSNRVGLFYFCYFFLPRGPAPFYLKTVSGKPVSPEGIRFFLWAILLFWLYFGGGGSGFAAFFEIFLWCWCFDVLCARARSQETNAKRKKKNQKKKKKRKKKTKKKKQKGNKQGKKEQQEGTKRRNKKKEQKKGTKKGNNKKETKKETKKGSRALWSCSCTCKFSRHFLRKEETRRHICCRVKISKYCNFSSQGLVQVFFLFSILFFEIFFCLQRERDFQKKKKKTTISLFWSQNLVQLCCATYLDQVLTQPSTKFWLNLFGIVWHFPFEICWSHNFYSVFNEKNKSCLKPAQKYEHYLWTQLR